MSIDPEFARDVREGLLRTPRELPPRYFYDALGSQLFEAICRLPWYRVTRGEQLLLERHGAAMLDGLAGSAAAPLGVAELGCGSGQKLATLLRAASAPVGGVTLIDISAAALAMATDHLSQLGPWPVHTQEASYDEGLARLATSRPVSDGPLLVLFLGSNIGNFHPSEGRALLGRIRRTLRPGDALLLGTDLVKPERNLLLAYDDPLQVTAAFNRNLLRRIDEELGGTFELDGFSHRAIWNAAESRVEMHLVSLRRQRVTVAACGLDLTFEAGETIWTESSYKYDPAAVVADGLAAGFGTGTGAGVDAAPGGVRQWIEPDSAFALTRFLVTP